MLQAAFPIRAFSLSQLPSCVSVTVLEYLVFGLRGAANVSPWLRKTGTNFPELVEVFESTQAANVTAHFFWPLPRDIQSGSSNAFLSIGLKSARNRAIHPGTP